MSDGEAVIRQHIAGQLVTLSLVAMYGSNNNDNDNNDNENGDTSNSDNNNNNNTLRRLPKHLAEQSPTVLVQLRYQHAPHDPTGYNLVCSHIVRRYIQEFVLDTELDVRRAAVDAAAGLVLHLQATHIVQYLIPMAQALASSQPTETTTSTTTQTGKKTKRTVDEQRMEELRITACNMLAEMGGAAAEYLLNVKHPSSSTSSSGSSSSSKRKKSSSKKKKKSDNNNNKDDTTIDWVHTHVIPLVLELCRDDSFRVRRSAVQALPRVMGASTLEQAQEDILPTFQALAADDVHRVRKSAGECLVDMSRAMVILAEADVRNHDDDDDDDDDGGGDGDEEQQQQQKKKKILYELRRDILLPIADQLIQDSHKQVRQGMMQFLGPFMASFYPYQNSPLHTLLPTSIESDGSHHMGIVAQFFPHASSMVARLNSSQNSIALTPTPVHSSLDPFFPKLLSDLDRVQKALPEFIHAARMSTLSLTAVTQHRQQHPPDAQDLEGLMESLLDYYVALSIVATGDENTDAEMRVYCAYSFPALVLLLGPEHWEGSMRTCFLTLLNPKFGSEEESESNTEENEEQPEPPLPVKRCLASSLHTIAHILGPDIAAKDILPVVRQYFLRDTDESVRLNMVRNFPSLLSVLPDDQRKETFLSWSEVIHGEDFLGGRKRSATNPLTLNWRQRDYLARSLPEIIGMVCPSLLHDHVWPILKMLLADSVNDVRDDASWSLAMLFRAYCPDTLHRWGADVKDPKRYSVENCAEVIEWILDNILYTPNPQQGGKSRSATFADRQLYCRICGSMGLALRLSEDLVAANRKDPVGALSEKFKSLFFKNETDSTDNGPYQRMTSSEVKHIKKILTEQLLPHALEMKEDRISNVRITLMKVLQILPFDLRTSPTVKPVLRTLEEENETWTSFGDENLIHEADEAEEVERLNGKSSGPVDVDVTPVPSEDEDERSPMSDNTGRAVTAGKSLMSGFNATTGENESGLRSVVFEDGPIGMQLEPTADENACRVYEFSDDSPASKSGKVFIGDVIVSVNGTKVNSYDETVDLLKKGGKREICFRYGVPEDAVSSDDDDARSSEGSSEHHRKKKKKKQKKKKASDDEDEDEAARRERKHRKKKERSPKSDDTTTSDEDDEATRRERRLRKEKKKEKKEKREKKDREKKAKRPKDE